MKLNRILVVVLVLAVLSAAVFVAHRPDSPKAADDRLGQPLVAQTLIEQARQLQLSDQGKNVTLNRQPDGNWRIASYYDLPADFAKLSSYVGSLGAAKLERLVTRNPERMTRLDFKDSKLTLLDAAGKELWFVTLGKNAESGGGRYIRFGAENKAYLTTFGISLDMEPKNWADTRLLDLKSDDIAKAEIPFDEASPVTLTRTTKEADWTSVQTPAGQKIKADRITSLLGSIGSLRFTDTAELNDAKVAAAKAHQQVFKLTTFQGKTYTVALGRKPEEKKIKPPVAVTTGHEKPSPETKSGEPATTADMKPEESKPAAPEFETIPAGPAFAFITSSDSAAPVNALMQKRAFQISDYVFNSLPHSPAEIFEPAPPPPAVPTKPAEITKP